MLAGSWNYLKEPTNIAERSGTALKNTHQAVSSRATFSQGTSQAVSTMKHRRGAGSRGSWAPDCEHFLTEGLDQRFRPPLIPRAPG